MPRQVAFVADHVAHWSAGTESQMLMLARGLHADGWDVPLFVLRGSDAVNDGSWPGPVITVGITSLSAPSAWWRAGSLAHRLRRGGFRVAHLFFNDTSILLPPFLRLSGIKVVIARRDMGFWYTGGRLRVLRVVRRAVDRVVANSRAVARRVCEAEGYSPDRVVVHYNGLLGNPEEAPLREVDPGHPVVGLVANVRPVKRVQDAVRAFALVAERHPSAELRIVGGGDTGPLAGLAGELGVGDRVVFTGRVSDATAEVHRFTVAMLTSESEGLSNAIIEYMQAGVPVICTDTGGNPELVADGETGFLAPVGNVDTMARRLGELLEDAELCRAMGERGRTRIHQLCDHAQMVRAHESLYNELASEKAGTEGGRPAVKRS